ncbi:MAG: DUF1818 family protein [Cyanobacteria bacterium P01_A01_bin.114]
MVRQIKEGEGWRIGWDADAIEFKGLLSGDQWALELTATEFDDFCRLAQQVADTMAAMANEMMDDERLACELETEQIWVESEGYPHAYSLRFILLTGRRSEGAWPVSAVPELLQAIAYLKVF